MSSESKDETCTCTLCKAGTTASSVEECLDARHQLSLAELTHLIDITLSTCEQLRDQTNPSGTSSCSNTYPRALIKSLLELYSSHHPRDWHRYECWTSSENYTRNLIAHHPNRFTLMLVCWKGGPSPVHNHAGSDCLMSIVRGAVREIKYHLPVAEQNVEELHVKETTELQEGEVHLINDQIGLHKMETLDESAQAVTLHCYIPPYADCLTFDSDNGEIKTHVAHTTYDTEYGKVIS